MQNSAHKFSVNILCARLILKLGSFGQFYSCSQITIKSKPDYRNVQTLLLACLSALVS